MISQAWKADPENLMAAYPHDEFHQAWKCRNILSSQNFGGKHLIPRSVPDDAVVNFQLQNYYMICNEVYIGNAKRFTHTPPKKKENQKKCCDKAKRYGVNLPSVVHCGF